MKIQPINIWKNGSLKEASWLYCSVVSDNLKDSATFYYTLSSVSENAPSEELAAGNLSMIGEDYLSWQTNEYAWDWVASQLGLTIINE